MIHSLRLLIMKSTLAKVLLLFFVVMTVWWITIYWRGLTEGLENNLFTLIYPWSSLVGSLWGFSIARYWGGLKSLVGKVIFFLALGLFAQFFGQVAYSIYIYILGIEVPYPSIGDLGYFGSVIFYIIAVSYLVRLVRVRFLLDSYLGMIQVIILPLVLLSFSYFAFLRDYELDWSQPLQMFLDFGYPLGQAIYLAIALLAYLISRKYVGGLMRSPILFLIFALVIQYVCDSMFIYEASRGEWYVAGVNDYLYLISYVAMAMALGNMGNIFNNIRSS